MIFTFSTKSKKPEDEQLVKEIKAHCEHHCISFSGLVVALLRQYKQDRLDGR